MDGRDQPDLPRDVRAAVKPVVCSPEPSVRVDLRMSGCAEGSSFRGREPTRFSMRCTHRVLGGLSPADGLDAFHVERVHDEQCERSTRSGRRDQHRSGGYGARDAITGPNVGLAGRRRMEDERLSKMGRTRCLLRVGPRLTPATIR